MKISDGTFSLCDTYIICISFVIICLSETISGNRLCKDSDA